MNNKLIHMRNMLQSYMNKTYANFFLYASVSVVEYVFVDERTYEVHTHTHTHSHT